MHGIQEFQDYQVGEITLKSYRVAKSPPATLAPERGAVTYPA